ncbi:MAG: metallophosphoesterase family protein [Promethearchaeia archaeon]
MSGLDQKQSRNASYACLMLIILILGTSSEGQNHVFDTVGTMSCANQTAQASDIGARIKWPRIGSPAILLNGSALQAEIRGSSNLTEWNLTLYRPYVQYNLSVTDSTWNDTTRSWVVNATIPTNPVKGLYDLVVRTTDGTQTVELTEFNAVQIRYSYPENFTIFHITDPHIKLSSSPRDDRLLSSLYQASMAGADIVVLSGDLVETGYEESFQRVVNLVKQSQVPVFVGPGNHDLDSDGGGFSIYSSFFGPDYYTAKLGPDMLLVMGNSHQGELNSTQIQWIERDLSQSDAQTKILCIHHPLYDLNEPPNYYLDKNEALTLVDICEENDVDMVLTGHLHNDRVDRVNGTLWVLTTAIGATVSSIPSEPDHLAHGFRVIEFKDYKPFSWNWTPQKDWSRPWDGLTMKRTPTLFRQPDVGGYVELWNGMNYSLENQVVDILVQPPLEDQDYLVSGDALVGRIPGSDAYLLRFELDLPPNGDETLRVYPDNAQAPVLNNVTYPEEVSVGEAYSIIAELLNPISGIVETYLNISCDGKSLGLVKMSTCGESRFCTQLKHDEAGDIEFQIISRDYAGNELVSEVYIFSCTEGPGAPDVILPIIGVATGVVLAAVAYYFYQFSSVKRK